MGVVFHDERGARTKVGSRVVAMLRGYAQHARSSLEAGGVLIGRLLRDCDDVVIDVATEPMVDDVRRRCSFTRACAAHQDVIEATWRASGRTLGYLGEWHTHPEAVPTPSRVDRRDWVRRLGRDHYEGDRLFFVIVGTKSMRMWAGTRRGGQIVQLTEERTHV